MFDIPSFFSQGTQAWLSHVDDAYGDSNPPFINCFPHSLHGRQSLISCVRRWARRLFSLSIFMHTEQLSIWPPSADCLTLTPAVGCSNWAAALPGWRSCCSLLSLLPPFSLLLPLPPDFLSEFGLVANMAVDDGAATTPPWLFHPWACFEGSPPREVPTVTSSNRLVK